MFCKMSQSSLETIANRISKEFSYFTANTLFIYILNK